MSVKVYFPTLPLQEAVAKGGGITRENAVAAALDNVRSISAEGDSSIDAAIQSLEAIIASAVQGRLAAEQLRAVLEQADQVVNMAGTFHYEALDRASRSLCDMTDGLLREGRSEVAPVAVHVRAMRLFSPLCAAPPMEVSTQILSELDKVTAHYNFKPLGSEA